MKKEKTLKQVMTEDWQDSKNATEFFRGMSSEEYIGYVTGMTLLQYSGKMNIASGDILLMAWRLRNEGKI